MANLTDEEFQALQNTANYILSLSRSQATGISQELVTEAQKIANAQNKEDLNEEQVTSFINNVKTLISSTPNMNEMLNNLDTLKNMTSIVFRSGRSTTSNLLSSGNKDKVTKDPFDSLIARLETIGTDTVEDCEQYIRMIDEYSKEMKKPENLKVLSLGEETLTNIKGAITVTKKGDDGNQASVNQDCDESIRPYAEIMCQALNNEKITFGEVTTGKEREFLEWRQRVFDVKTAVDKNMLVSDFTRETTGRNINASSKEKRTMIPNRNQLNEALNGSQKKFYEMVANFDNQSKKLNKLQIAAKNKLNQLKSQLNKQPSEHAYESLGGKPSETRHPEIPSNQGGIADMVVSFLYTITIIPLLVSLFVKLPLPSGRNFGGFLTKSKVDNAPENVPDYKPLSSGSGNFSSSTPPTRSSTSSKESTISLNINVTQDDGKVIPKDKVVQALLEAFENGDNNSLSITSDEGKLDIKKACEELWLDDTMTVNGESLTEEDHQALTTKLGEGAGNKP